MGKEAGAKVAHEKKLTEDLCDTGDRVTGKQNCRSRRMWQAKQNGEIIYYTPMVERWEKRRCEGHSTDSSATTFLSAKGKITIIE